MFRTVLSVAAVLLGLGLLGAPARALAQEPTDADPSDSEDAPPADKEPPSEPATDDDSGWIDVGVHLDFGSAIETGLEDDAAAGTPPESLHGLVAAMTTPDEAPSHMPRARFGLRPLLGAHGVLSSEATPSTSAAWGGSAGARMVHQWWTLPSKTLRPAGETRLQATALFGGVSGYDVLLESVAGLWLGPIGLFAGPHAHLDQRRVDAEAVLLPSAVTLGPSAHLATRLGPVTPWVSFTPTWIVSGDRAPLTDTEWHEQALRGGLVLQRGTLQLRIGGGLRQTAPGEFWDASLGAHIRF